MQTYVIALYIRLSVEDHKYDSMSIRNQRMLLREQALSLPEGAEAEILEFVDNGFSGANFERPAVQRLIELVRENKIDCIMVKDFSRFGRNSIETGYFIERVFPLFHTRFISVSDSYDSNCFKGDTGGMDVAFKYLISEYYSRDMSMKTKSAKYAKMQRGEYQSKICPYGFRKSADGRMEPDPEAAEVVRQIFAMAAEKMSVAAITRELTKRGIPTPGEYRAARGPSTHDISRTKGVWVSSTVLRMLEDERYIGTYVMGKNMVTEVGGSRKRARSRDKWIIIPDHHPAIVGEEIFQQVQPGIRRNKQVHKNTLEYPLKGKVFCGCCRHALARTTSKTSYYYCRHADAAEEAACHKMRRNTQELERTVFDLMRKQLELLRGTKWAASSTPPGISAQQAAYEQQLTALRDAKRELYEQYLTQQLDLAAYRERKADCDARLLKTKNACAAAMAQTKKEQQNHDDMERRQRMLREVKKADGLTQSLSDALISKVLVFPDNRIEIVYEYQDIFRF